MITKNDIVNLETTVNTYRDLTHKLEHEEKRLHFFQQADKSLKSSFNVFRRNVTEREVEYTLEANEIIPVIKNKITALEKGLSALRIPELQSVTTKV